MAGKRSYCLKIESMTLTESSSATSSRSRKRPIKIGSLPESEAVERQRKRILSMK